MEPERRLSVDGEPGLLLVLQQQLKDTPGRLSPLLRRQTVRMGQEYGSPLDRKAWGADEHCAARGVHGRWGGRSLGRPWPARAGSPGSAQAPHRQARWAGVWAVGHGGRFKPRCSLTPGLQ